MGRPTSNFGVTIFYRLKEHKPTIKIFSSGTSNLENMAHGGRPISYAVLVGTQF